MMIHTHNNSYVKILNQMEYNYITVAFFLFIVKLAYLLIHLLVNFTDRNFNNFNFKVRKVILTYIELLILFQLCIKKQFFFK